MCVTEQSVAAGWFRESRSTENFMILLQSHCLVSSENDTRGYLRLAQLSGRCPPPHLYNCWLTRCRENKQFCLTVQVFDFPSVFRNQQSDEVELSLTPKAHGDSPVDGAARHVHLRVPVRVQPPEEGVGQVDQQRSWEELASVGMTWTKTQKHDCVSDRPALIETGSTCNLLF